MMVIPSSANTRTFVDYQRYLRKHHDSVFDYDDDDSVKTMYHHRLKDIKAREKRTDNSTRTVIPVKTSGNVIDLVVSAGMYHERIRQRNKEDNKQNDHSSSKNTSRRRKSTIKSTSNLTGKVLNQPLQIQEQNVDTTKAKKKVRFDMDRTRIHTIPHYRMTETFNIWYSAREYRQMEILRKRTLTYLRNAYSYDYPVNFDTFCYVGLEKHLNCNELCYIKEQENKSENERPTRFNEKDVITKALAKYQSKDSRTLAERKSACFSNLITIKHQREQRQKEHQQQQQKVYHSTDLITKSNARSLVVDTSTSSVKQESLYNLHSPRKGNQNREKQPSFQS